MNEISFSFSPLALVLLCIAIVAALIAAVLCLAPMRNTAKYRKDPVQPPREDDSDLPMISVIVHAHNRDEQIVEYLDSIVSQRYPRFEVIVVNDSGADDNTVEVVEGYAINHPNVYCTFLPIKSYNVSRRKMALTLGIKAAKGDVILTTSAACKPQSDLWLAAMGRHFLNRHTDIVAGYTYPDVNRMEGKGRWYRAFDNVYSASLWVGYALAGETYRADGLNLAFRRSIFFEKKGYAQSTFLQDGDDDIFISEIAGHDNVKVEINPEAQLVRSWRRSDYKMWLNRKERYHFTARFLKTTAFIYSRIYMGLVWLVPALAAWAIASNPTSMAGIIVAALTVLLFWGYQICVFRRASKVLNGPKVWWNVPFFTMFRPLSEAWYSLRFFMHRHDNLTWAPRKQL